LVAVQPKGPTGRVGFALDTEDPTALGMQNAGVDEVVDLAASLEVRVQGDPRFGPQDPSVQLGPDEVIQPGSRILRKPRMNSP
jgi:hypothetical protein